MKIKHLTEVVWKFYSDGRPKATAQTLNKADIMQMCLLTFADQMRTQYIKSKAADEFNEADYAFTSPILDIKRFKLSDANGVGMRRADMGEFDLMRLPKNAHFTNLYPVGSDCQGDLVGDITQVNPGEENFYLSPDFSSYQFFVVKGRGVNTYHVPPCIKEIDIETTYSSDDMDISTDLAYTVAMIVLGTAIKVNGVPIKLLDNNYSPQPREVKHKLQEAETNI